MFYTKLPFSCLLYNISHRLGNHFVTLYITSSSGRLLSQILFIRLERLYLEDLYNRCSEEGSRAITAERDSLLDVLTCRQTPTPSSNRAAAV